MPTCQPRQVRAPLSYASLVVSGRAWTARRIKNQSLRRFCRDLGKTFQKPEYSPTATLRLSTIKLVEQVELHSRIMHCPDAHRRTATVLLRLAQASPHWIREPSTWRPSSKDAGRSQLQDLIRHLFERTPLPDFMHNAWFEKGVTHTRQRAWYLKAATVGMDRFLKHLPRPQLSKKARAIIKQSPAHWPIAQALRRAQLSAMGWTGEHGFILESPIGTDFGNDSLWLPLLQMGLARRYLSLAEFLLITEALAEEIRQAYPHPIRLKGRSWQDLQRTAQAYCQSLATFANHQGLAISLSDLQKRGQRRRLLDTLNTEWNSSGIAPWFHDRNEDHWQIVELRTPQQLIAEGRVLDHCVASYARLCRRGFCAIFSLRVWLPDEQSWDPYLTIEYDPRNRHLYQARSLCNADPHAIERELLLRWAQRHDIQTRLLF